MRCWRINSLVLPLLLLAMSFVSAQTRPSKSNDYLSPELRQRVEKLKREVKEKPTLGATAKERALILWEWSNAYALAGGFVPENLSFESGIVLIEAEKRISLTNYVRLDQYVHEMTVLDEMPGALGTLASNTDGPFQINSYQTIQQTYTVGEMPMVPGGGILLAKHNMSDEGQYQAEDPAADNYVTVSSSNQAARFVSASVRVRGVQGGHIRPAQTLAFRIAGTSLKQGETVTITYGDRSGGSKGFKVQSMSSDRYPLPVYVDLEGKDNFFSLPLQSYKLLGGPVFAVHGFAPSVVGVGEAFEVSVRSEDLGYNRASGPIPAYEVTANGKHIANIKAGTKAITVLPGLKFDTPGVYRFAIRSKDGSITGISNPVWVKKTPGSRIYWGDTHGHSGFAEGQGTPEGFYRYGRDDARLDFLTFSEHDIWLDDAEWNYMIELTQRFNDEGNFIALLGYEWTMPVNRGGHHNVFFRSPVGRKRQGLHTATTLSMLYQDLRAANDPGDVLVIPHCHESGDWRLSDPSIESLVEIMSMHGTFEWFGKYYLQHGHQVGFVAASDDHMGKPGYSGPKRSSHQRNGLAAVLAPEKTTDAIFTALKNRATYATTGERIIVDYRLNGALMGSRAPFAEERHIEGRAIGTAPIDTITVVKNGEAIWSRDYLTVENDASSYFELSFNSESRPLVRDNPRKYHMWNGTISVKGAGLADIAGAGFENRVYDEVEVDPNDPNKAHFNTATRGQKRSIVFRLNSAGEDASVEVNLEPNVEQGSGASMYRPPAKIPGSLTVFSIKAMRKGKISKEFQVGRYSDVMTLRRINPKGKLEQNFEFTDTDSPNPGDYYYVRIDQLNNEIAWSSPIWVGGNPPL